MNAEFDEFAERVRARSDIHSVVSKYVALKFKNGRFWGRCPFHDGDAESFTISPDKGFFYCFHCHAGGDVFKFISLKEKISYFEAVKRQAEKLGMLNLKRRKEILFKINRLARDFYNKFLTKADGGQAGRKYLEARGITGDTVEKFKIGFAPKSSDELTKFLLSRKFTAEQMLDSGLILRQDGKLVDRLQECVIVPMTNVFGRVVGIGGRILNPPAESDSPKFFDIPKTIIFDEENFIFGANKSVDSLIIVKNCLDAIFLQSAGIENVAAVLSANFTEKQLKFLLQYAKKIILCLDDEEIKILPIITNFEDKIFFVSMPEGENPQNFVRKNGKEKFYELIKNALSVVDYRLKNILNQNAHSAPEEKITTLKKIFQIILDEKNSKLTKEYLKKFSVALELDEKIIFEEWKKLHSPPPEKKVEPPARVKPKIELPKKHTQENDSLFALTCRSMLRICWLEDDLLSFVLGMMPEESFSEVHKEILDYIKKSADEERRPELSSAKDELSDKAYNEISKILSEHGDDPRPTGIKAFDDSVRAARRIFLQKTYNKKVAEANGYLAKNELAVYDKLIEESRKIKKEIDSL